MTGTTPDLRWEVEGSPETRRLKVTGWRGGESMTASFQWDTVDEARLYIDHTIEYTKGMIEREFESIPYGEVEPWSAGYEAKEKHGKPGFVGWARKGWRRKKFRWWAKQ